MPITVEICQQVTDEVVAAFERLVPQLSSSARVPSRSELNEIAANESLLIARDSDQDNLIVGSLTLVTFRIPTGVRAWIEDVVVDEAARGKGAGEALTRRALERAAELGSKTVDLTSRPTREAANRLYQRVGFELRHSNLYRYNLK
ncbi:MAG TPA: GNAT family N-acetyltransferase [Bellilinea sp.]|jgi:ribosomal protein S18 acetylase RimI-like enzyme|nr:GNAT family N-acetyltransferase [Bellilinea sp.]